MNPLKRSLSVLICTLVLFTASVFSFGGVAHAEGLDTQVTNPLRSNEPVLQQMTQVVSDKQSAIGDQTDQIQQLEAKKQDLTSQLADIQKDVADLNQKIADKKAAYEAEQARIKALQDMFVHVTRYASDSADNLYAFGNCTWYVKNRRPDLPNNLGNANTWYSMAAADGFSVGSAPKKGAVGTTTAGWLGHVVYVEGVSLDGSTVYISEMNYAGFDVISTRSAPASEFLYIYQL
jgi:surface antigen